MNIKRGKKRLLIDVPVLSTFVAFFWRRSSVGNVRNHGVYLGGRSYFRFHNSANMVFRSYITVDCEGL